MKKKKMIIFLGIMLMLLLINLLRGQYLLGKCENILSEHIEAINSRDVSMHTYEDDSSLRTEKKYNAYYEELMERDEVYYKNSYEEKYKADMIFLERCLGEGFKITYSIKSKKELGLERIFYILEELRYVGKQRLDEFDYYEEKIRMNLANFDIKEDEIEKGIKLLKKFRKEMSKVWVTKAFKLDVVFTIESKEKLNIEMEIYFAEVNGKLIMLDYTPEEPEEDNEHFGFSDGINPSFFADEVECYTELDWTDRGVSKTWHGSIILEECDGWLQNDDSGNSLFFKKDEESGITTLEYIDEAGNIINEYEGVCDYRDQFIYVYSDFDEEVNEYSGLKKVITLFYCNEERAVFEIDGKEVKFVKKQAED